MKSKSHTYPNKLLNHFTRKKINIPLVEVVAISFVLHILALLILGGFVIHQTITPEEVELIAPPIVEETVNKPLKVSLKKIQKRSSQPKQIITVKEITQLDLASLSIDAPIIGEKAGFSSYSGNGLGMNLSLEKMSLNFFGLESEANSVVFVVDISGSMIQEKRGKDGFKKVSEEILRVLRQARNSSSSMKFNIIGFAGDAKAMSGGMVDLSSESLRKAERWLNEHDPANALKKYGDIDSIKWKEFKNGLHVGTRADLGLEKGFKKQPELIIFLSDGEPTNTGATQVIKMVSQWQGELSNPIMLNTISYKSERGKTFLRELAMSNKGAFQTIQ